MESFLYNVAQRIWNENHDKMENILVVFNNRRAGLFLQRQFQNIDSKPFFLPRIIGIDDLVNELGGNQIAPHELLLFELFDIHKKLDGVESRFETFEEFISFGEMMINDFSEIDLYCVDAKQLFENLHDLKRLGEWDISGAPLTTFQEKYLNFYRSLYQYYSQLRERLTLQGRAYSGMAYRNVAEHIDSMIDKLNYSHIYFVGFNALSTCERKIIDCCVRRGIGSVIFDGDDYYFSNEVQESGLFLRQHAEHFPGVGNYKEHFALEPKTLHIINSPENVLQAKATGHIIDEIVRKYGTTEGEKFDKHLEDTAIVLADESLLLPVLNSLPESIHSTNVTMGYPYTLSDTHNLVTKILALYSRKRKDGMYHADITALLSNQLITRLLGSTNLHSEIAKKINDEKIIYVTPEEMAQMLDNVPNSERILFLFENSNPTVDEILTKLRQITTLLSESDILTKNIKEQEALDCMVQMVNYFEELQKEYKFIEKVETLQKIYLRLALRRNIPFYGEPLQGLQILGMLETRSLDFKRLILLSLNEGTLPAGRGDNTLIPLSLKRSFVIPTFEEKDAVYAYHFYRLLQRVDEAWLIYSSDSESLGKGEPSRFILQIKNELVKKYPNIAIDEKVLVAVNQTADPRVEKTTSHEKKTEKTMTRLQELAAKGFAPSALNRYRSCPMMFYYEDVLGIWEKEEISDELESNELGSFIHETLCEIYNLDTNKNIRYETLEEALKNIDSHIDKSFSEKLLKGRDSTGKNLLFKEVAKTQIKRLLEKEIYFLKSGGSIKIVLTEESMLQPLDLHGCGISHPVNIKGVADRIDIVNGILRIADYKSGKVEVNELRVADMNPDPMGVPDKWFQVMTYAWLYYRKHQYNKPFLSGIFPLRNLSSGFMTAQWGNTEQFSAAEIERFENILRDIVGEILDKEQDFEATPKKSNCQYCPFRVTCPVAAK